MARRVRSLLVVGVILVGCTPVASGPLPPRPTQPAPVRVVTTTTTTTAPEVGEVLDSGPACPTDFCLFYRLDAEVTWSDGSPISAEDFAHTASLATQQPGYSLISGVETVDDDGVLVVFDEPYGAWESLFDRMVHPGGTGTRIEDLETSGPFQFGEWAEGEYLTIRRNPDWWGDHDPISGDPLGDVAEITFVFFDDPDAMVDALEDGDVDVVTARADLDVVQRLSEMENVSVDVAPGPFWEHVDFHHDDPILSQRWAREAISLAINREEILDLSVRQVDPEAGALDNTIWMSGTPHYEAHFPDSHDPERAEQILISNGCERGEDGVYVCQDTRMSFTWASTNDDPTRRVIFDQAREDLEAIGIEIAADFRSPSDFVTRNFLFGGPDVWQMINFSWRASPEPQAANSTFYCDGAGVLNINSHCSEQVESLIRSTATIVEPDERAAVYNQADRAYLDDVAVIPLYQKPTLMAWDDVLTGPAPNYTLSSDLWNIAAWSGQESIVVALPAEPRDLNPFSTSDDNANVILGTLLYGSFGMTPSQDLVPVLVESVEVIEGNR